jgi:hypothetical protein
VAKKPGIKTFSNCFNEMKRLSGDSLSDKEINEFLDEIKIKINEDKFREGEAKTEKILQEEIYNDFEYQQAFKKREIAENNIKAINVYQQITDAIDLSKGTIDAEKGVLAKLVGIQEFSLIARDSIGARQFAVEEVELNKLYHAINKVSKTAWEDFSSGKLDQEIKLEMTNVTTGLKEAKAIADILKKSQEDWRLRLNDLGANIQKLDDWITRTVHDTEKMGRASKGSKLHADNRAAWTKKIREKLDIKRTFRGEIEASKIDSILNDMYDSLMSGDHLKHGGVNSIYGTRNVTNRLNASRVLHFKDAYARHEYDIEFGEPSLKESVLSVLRSTARNIPLIESLGTNPKAGLEKVLSLLRKKYKDSDPKMVQKLNLSNFKSQFAELDGSVNLIGNQTAAKVGMFIRGFQRVGKLGFSTVSSFSDLAQYMGTTNFQGRGLFTGLQESMTALFRKQDKAAMEVLEVISNSVIGSNNNRFSQSDSVGKFAKAENSFFKWIGLNGWVSNLKSGMTVGLARHYGMLADTAFGSLAIRERNLLKLYGIDEGKWNMLRSIKTLDSNNKRYMTAEAADDLADDVIKQYVGRSMSDREIRNFKKDLELTWRNVLVDQATHGTPEPDAAVRAFMNQGLEKGTFAGETIRFVGQFKSFAVTIYKKIIQRELKSYGPDDSKYSKFTGLSSILILTSMFGYLAMSAKDMLRGRSPRDVTKLSTILESIAQGGGLGIYGDFLLGQVQNEYGSSVYETLLGPTASDANKLLSIVFNPKDVDNASKRILQLIEGNAPVINMFYTRAAYDYLIGYKIKEIIDPGFFERMRAKHEENRGQTYFVPNFLKP